VEEHLGSDFTKRIILTRDKSLVRGDVLVDDKPEIRGLATPNWQHILYDQPYNRCLPGVRMTWRNWRHVLRQHVGETVCL
jgi:5'-nucleotidase